jgi:hypothetical protein
VAQFRDSLGKYADQITAAISQIVRRTALNIERDWKADVRVDTGFYRNSIQTVVEGPMKASVVSNAEHSVHNEYGTHKMSGRPSARKAADKHRAQMLKDMQNLERSLK